jgi:hypothetical protein
MIINILFVNCFFREHDDYKLFSLAAIFLFCTIWWVFNENSLLWWVLKRISCESMLITCLRFVSKCKMWSEKCDSDLFFAKIVWTIHSRDHAWSSHRQFFWSFSLIFQRMTYAHSRLSNDACLFSICQTTFVMKRLIKHDESDSSNLTKKTLFHQIWRENVISSNLTKTTHQTFWKERQSFYFLISNFS